MAEQVYTIQNGGIKIWKQFEFIRPKQYIKVIKQE